MIDQHRGLLVAGAVAVAVQWGCSSTPPRVGTTETTGAAWMDIEGAVHALAAAHCDREIACDRVGKDRRYSDRNTCVLENHRAAQAELQAGGCSGAIEHREFEECQQALQHTACAQPLQSIPREKACRAEELCARLQRGSMGG